LSLSLRQITHTLQDTFHIQSFRETQQNVIQATLSGQDCFVIMRTVGGKSLTYQLPAVLELPKVTLVISPLLSLIQDQQDQMNSFLPQSCVSFTSGMGQAMHTQNWQRVRDPNGGVAMVLVTPEKVTKSSKLKSELQKLHQQNRQGRIVIDECHCACQWGHDFRPDYAKLGILKTQFPTVPILAVTATASERVRNDCSNILRLHQHYRFFRSTANRPNLIYQVRPKDTSSDVLEDMTSFIKEHHTNAAGIIYTYSKKDANTVAEELCGQGIVAEAYHSE
jgi:RecQ family ATP-dependent DNA helicase